MEILGRTNWIDILAIIIVLRISYVGSYLGVGRQLLPLLSLLFTFIFILYFYDNIAAYFITKFALSYSVVEFLVFLLLIIPFTFITRIINKYLTLKIPENLNSIERFGGAVLGFLRSIVTTGLVMVLLLLVPIEGAEKSVRASASGNSIIRLNLDFYTKIVNILQRKYLKKKDEDFEELSIQGVLAQLTKTKDYEIRIFGGDLKKKSRFFKEEKVKDNEIK